MHLIETTNEDHGSMLKNRFLQLSKDGFVHNFSDLLNATDNMGHAAVHSHEENELDISAHFSCNLSMRYIR